MAEKAEQLGFDLCRVAAPDAIPEAPARLRAWLDSGAAGDMDWMHETADRRGDPRVLWPEVRSIVMLGLNYGPSDNPLALLDDRGAANVSVYARHRDYHDVIKGRLKELAGVLASAGAGVKVFVDTAPVMEKPLAEAAGIGWQGKHTNLVSRGFGSWLFLGSIFTTALLEPDVAEPDHCGSCRACLDICPTSAFPAPYRLDARRCISYLTIEHKGHIPREFRRPIGNRVYGCDDCLAVCPWNKWARQAREAKFLARDEFRAPRLADWLGLDDTGFRRLFAGSPVKRIGRARFLRNLLIAAGNSGDRAVLEAILPHLRDASALVRAMAVWAVGELETAANLSALASSYSGDEPDPGVRAEWAALRPGAALPLNGER
ncbi:MAG: tRNA epoxyqueuosine(34) reductase QueG [Beijerinckiaceae bacterium]|nr:tRNA epoxyqueuosine(34) reductase QueG [Beijerinckiaceae bacterium]